jgi:hypothetical protein
MILGGLFFGACLAFYVHRGSSNQRGLIIDHVIELGIDGATTFYWVLAAASAGFVLIALWALAVRALRDTYLVLDERELSIPSRWSKRVRVIPYSEIRGIELVQINGQHLLYLATESGRVTVAGIMLESDERLRELGQELTRRVKP